MQPAKTLYKSSRWCTHAYCLNCWMKKFNQEIDSTFAQCPHPQCTIALPPSLFLALEYDQANVEKETLNKAHASCQDFHKNFDEQLINKLNDAAHCQKCRQFLLLDSTNPKNRTIQCSCDARYMVIANAEGGLLPIDAFHNLGKCQCGALVEFAGRAAPNQQIDCPFCKRTRLWTPLK